MAVPDRPDPNEVIASAWGDWLQDHTTTPTRAALWRTTSLALGVDGANAVTYEAKDDPKGIAQGASTLKMPAAGVVVVEACSAMSLSGTAAAVQLYAYLTVNGAEARRGNQLACPAAGMPSAFASHLGGLLVVALNDVLGVTMYAQGAGVTKSLFGARAYQFLEVCYLTAY